MYFVSPWCGCLKGCHYRVFGSCFGIQYLYSGDPGGRFGTFGFILVTFPNLLVSKWEVRLRTSFVSVFGVEKQPKALAVCC